MKPKSNIRYAEEGFSLVEILVVIAITGILAWLTLSVYLFGQRYFINWNKDLNLQNELHVIIQGMAEDIYRAERIVAFDEHKLVLQMDDDTERSYEAKNDTLFRNSRKLPGRHLSLADFRVLSKQMETGTPGGSRRSGSGKVTYFEISLSLTNGDDTLSGTRAVHLRKPSNWNYSMNQ